MWSVSLFVHIMLGANDKTSVKAPQTASVLLTMLLLVAFFVTGKIIISQVLVSDVCLWVEGVKGPFLSRWLSGLVTVWGSFTALWTLWVCCVKGGFDPLVENCC